MKYLTLNNGVKIPQLGFGVCRIDDLTECQEVVRHAINKGYRLFDTATIYNNEEAVGNAIKKSGICREEFFITTKLNPEHNNYNDAKNDIETSLRLLQTDYIDLYLIHRPVGDYYGAYRAMIEAYQEGKIKSLGVSNFFDDRLYDLMIHFDQKPVINQLQCHPFMQRNKELQRYQGYNVVLECWSPFAVGAKNIFTNPVLKEIGKKYNKSIAQTILRWHIQRGCIVIPKSIHFNRIAENMDIWDFHLTKEDMNKIETLDLTDTIDFDSSEYRIGSINRALHI